MSRASSVGLVGMFVSLKTVDAAGAGEAVRLTVGWLVVLAITVAQSLSVAAFLDVVVPDRVPASSSLRCSPDPP
ncbi:MAG: hypothetical protein ABIS35_09945 [Terracoccus sp.]